MKLIFSDNARDEYLFWQKADKKIISRINTLIHKTKRNPFEGIGVEANPKGEARKVDADYKSRTQRKNEDKALQNLGKQLVKLPFSQLEAIDLPDELLTEIESARKMKSHGARRRQIHYIGTLMRHIDPQPIQNALDPIRGKKDSRVE